MFEKIRCDEFLRGQSKLEMFFVSKLRHDLCEGAEKHLHRGLMVRLHMMQEAILNFDRELGNSVEPLDCYLATQLTLYLNSYYLNLAGSLDNMAWALAHQHNLIAEINEDKREHQRLVQLVDKAFLKLLKEHNLESLRTKLKPSRSWCLDIRQFRDPAAHRIPLLVPHTVKSEEDVQHSKEMDEQAAVLISQGNWEEGNALMQSSLKLGKHEPIFITESTKKISDYDLAKQINHDHEMFLKVINDVLEEGFRAKA